jgi:carbonic anhydrase/acetyltransferase-like protein (isoleucine patch superfamily)
MTSESLHEPRVIRPTLGRNVYIAPTSYVGGDVTVGDDTTIMHHVMIRGDVSAIRIGARCNIQDMTVVHTKTGVDLDIADEVSVGHRAVVHCRRVGRGSLIGIGAIVLDDAEIGEHCLIAAAALVPPGMKVPDGKVVIGIPGKVVRDITEEDRRYMRFVVERYLDLGKRHAAGQFPRAGDVGVRW